MAPNEPNGPEPVWKLGPISIKRTADIIAVVAFILSIVGLLAQVRDYLRGADIVLFVPQQLTVGNSKAFKLYFQNDSNFFVFTAIMSYVNSAPAGYNGAVGREYAKFSIGGKRYQYAAHQTVNTSAAETGLLNVLKKEDSGPFAVTAGSAVSREVLFLPHPVRCGSRERECLDLLPVIKWADFIDRMKENPRFTVTLLADVYGRDTLSVECNIALNANDIRALSKDDQQWSAPDCVEEKKIGLWERIFGKHLQ